MGAGSGVVVWLRFRTVGGAPTGNRGWRSTREGRSTRPGCEGGGLGGCGLTPLSYRGRCSYRSEEHTSELQSRPHLVCRLLLEKKKKNTTKKLHTDIAHHC